MRNWSWIRKTEVASILLFVPWLLPISLQAQEKPLPDPQTFIAEFRKTLHSDDKLLSQYTYTHKETRYSLDSKGNTKKSETNVYQVFRSEEEWKTYRRQIVKDGVPVTAKELEKKDRDETERIEKETKRRGKQSDEKRQQEKAKADREEQELLDDVFAMYELQFVRREALDGVSTILVAFAPKPSYKPKNSDAKNLQHIGGRAWIAEEDHELVQLEAEILDPISIGGGILAKLQKGSTLSFRRKKINGEIWLPVRAEVTLNAKVLLFKGFNMRDVSEFSEHKKFDVDIQLIFGEITGPAPQ